MSIKIVNSIRWKFFKKAFDNLFLFFLYLKGWKICSRMIFFSSIFLLFYTFCMLTAFFTHSKWLSFYFSFDSIWRLWINSLCLFCSIKQIVVFIWITHLNIGNVLSDLSVKIWVWSENVVVLKLYEKLINIYGVDHK